MKHCSNIAICIHESWNCSKEWFLFLDKIKRISQNAATGKKINMDVVSNDKGCSLGTTINMNHNIWCNGVRKPDFKGVNDRFSNKNTDRDKEFLKK